MPNGVAQSTAKTADTHEREAAVMLALMPLAQHKLFRKLKNLGKA
jgi:hypothetical protein